MDWDTVLDIHLMSLWVPHSAFWDWQVDFGPPYSYTLYAKFGVSKPVIINDSCVVKSWFTFANLQSVSLKLPQSKHFYFILYLVFEYIYICTLKRHCIACLTAGRINTHRDTYLAPSLTRKSGTHPCFPVWKWPPFLRQNTDFSAQNDPFFTIKHWLFSPKWITFLR